MGFLFNTPAAALHGAAPPHDDPTPTVAFTPVGALPADNDPGAAVIDLAAVREARDEAAGADAHDRGEAFSFELRDDLAEGDAPVGHAGGVVTLLLDTEALTGIALSPAAARRLATTLIDLAHLAETDTPC